MSCIVPSQTVESFQIIRASNGRVAAPFPRKDCPRFLVTSASFFTSRTHKLHLLTNQTRAGRIYTAQTFGKRQYSPTFRSVFINWTGQNRLWPVASVNSIAQSVIWLGNNWMTQCGCSLRMRISTTWFFGLVPNLRSNLVRFQISIRVLRMNDVKITVQVIVTMSRRDTAMVSII